MLHFFGQSSLVVLAWKVLCFWVRYVWIHWIWPKHWDNGCCMPRIWCSPFRRTWSEMLHCGIPFIWLFLSFCANFWLLTRDFFSSQEYHKLVHTLTTIEYSIWLSNPIRRGAKLNIWQTFVSNLFITKISLCGLCKLSPKVR